MQRTRIQRVLRYVVVLRKTRTVLGLISARSKREAIQASEARWELRNTKIRLVPLHAATESLCTQADKQEQKAELMESINDCLRL